MRFQAFSRCAWLLLKLETQDCISDASNCGSLDLHSAGVARRGAQDDIFITDICSVLFHKFAES